MKLKKESTTSVIRNKYTVQFKEQVLERADRDGIPIVAIDLGLSESMLYSWRSKLRQTNQPRLGHFVMRVVQWGFSIFQTVENTFN